MEELRQPHIDGGEAYLGAECLEPFANEQNQRSKYLKQLIE